MPAKKKRARATPAPAANKRTPAPRHAASESPPAPTPASTSAAKKYSALDAAALVLRASGQPLSCPELIAQMAAQGYWSSPRGQTPASTLYAALVREVQRKGTAARFVKTGPGRFAWRDAATGA
jgi:hypothetical protein